MYEKGNKFMATRKISPPPQINKANKNRNFTNSSSGKSDSPIIPKKHLIPKEPEMFNKAKSNSGLKKFLK